MDFSFVDQLRLNITNKGTGPFSQHMGEYGGLGLGLNISCTFYYVPRPGRANLKTYES